MKSNISVIIIYIYYYISKYIAKNNYFQYNELQKNIFQFKRN